MVATADQDLVAKDYPLLVQKSALTKVSVGHFNKYARVITS